MFVALSTEPNLTQFYGCTSLNLCLLYAHMHEYWHFYICKNIVCGLAWQLDKQTDSFSALYRLVSLYLYTWSVMQGPYAYLDCFVYLVLVCYTYLKYSWLHIVFHTLGNRYSCRYWVCYTYYTGLLFL